MAWWSGSSSNFFIATVIHHEQGKRGSEHECAYEPIISTPELEKFV